VSLPLGDTFLSIVKDDFIPSFPDNPASCDHDLSKNSAVESLSSLENHIQRTEVQVPYDWDGSPTIPAERTLKEQMEASLFATLIT
jgi:hypothetical protein